MTREEFEVKLRKLAKFLMEEEIQIQDVDRDKSLLVTGGEYFAWLKEPS